MGFVTAGAQLWTNSAGAEPPVGIPMPAGNVLSNGYDRVADSMTNLSRI
jgi:hypothetical protein